MRPVTILLAATFACSGGETAPEEAASTQTTPAEEPPAVEEPEVKPNTQMVDGKERAAYHTEDGQMTSTWTFGGKKVEVTAEVQQISMRIGNLPTLDYPIGHVRLDSTKISIPSHQEWVEPFEKTVLTNYSTPIQLFFDVSSVADMVGTLDAPGSEAAGLVLGGLQANDTKLETTVPASFTRTEEGLRVEVRAFEVPLADLRLDEATAAFAAEVGAGTPGPTVSISGTLEFPYFTGMTLPNFVRVPVTISRARDIEDKIDEEVSEVDAAKRRLSVYGFDDNWFKQRNLDEATLRRNKEWAEQSRGRHRQIDLGAKQQEMGRAADGTER